MPSSALSVSGASVMSRERSEAPFSWAVVRGPMIGHVTPSWARSQAKATAAYRDAATSCNSCHKVYRGVDANNQFIIKPGTV
jgi:cytochrome c553